jgi:hypothetical protein
MGWIKLKIFSCRWRFCIALDPKHPGFFS